MVEKLLEEPRQGQGGCLNYSSDRSWWMNQAGSYECGEKWLDSENLQTGKPIGFPDRLDVGVRERGVKNGSVDFGPNNWKNVAAIYRNGEDSG